MENPLRYSLSNRLKERHIQRLLQIRPGDQLLEVGCGIGFYLKECRNLGARTVGMDIHQESLELAKKYTGGEYILGSAEILPFKDNSFDKILFSDVIEHLPNDEQAIREIARVLKPGGAIILVTVPLGAPLVGLPVKEILHQEVGTPQYHERDGYQKEELVGMIERNSLSVNEVAFTNFFIAELLGGVLKWAYHLRNFKKAYRSQADLKDLSRSPLFQLYKNLLFPLFYFISRVEEHFLGRWQRGHAIIIKATSSKNEKSSSARAEVEKEAQGVSWDNYWSAGSPKRKFFEFCRRSILAPIVRRLITHQCHNRNVWILEAGSGSGTYLKNLLKHGYSKVVGVDVSPEACRLTYQAGTFAVQGDLRFLPFKDKSLDVVFNQGVMEHFDDATFKEILRELKRVANKVMVIVPSNLSLFQIHDPIGDDPQKRFFSQRELRNLLKQELKSVRSRYLWEIGFLSVTAWGISDLGNSSVKNCPICNHESSRHRYAWNSTEVLECARCGFLYVNGNRNDAELDEFYQVGDYYTEIFAFPVKGLQEKILDDLREEFAPVLKHHNKGRILDFGCADGDFLGLLDDALWEKYGVDVSQAAISRARTKYPYDFRIGHLDSFNFPSDHFQVVTMWMVLEHLADPKNALTEVNRILAPGGVVAIKVPNKDGILMNVAEWLYFLTGGVIANPLQRFFASHHINHFNFKTLSNLLRNCGFEIYETNTRERYVTRHALDCFPFWQRSPLIALRVLGAFFGRQDGLYVYARKSSSH